MKTIYIIDANALIDASKYYNMKKFTFAPIWTAIEELISQGELTTMIKIKSSSNSNGDPFLVATAIQYGGCVITNERLGDEKSGDFHIPNVCNGYNIPYMDLNTFLDHVLK